MQDPSTYSPINPQFPEHEHLKCPRCDSNNTKFCYYNNYNLLQPRHFCKDCKRYWTKGGTLRNIPVGGGTRKITKRSSNTKRSSPTSSSPSPSPAPATPTSPTTATSSSDHYPPKPEASRVDGVDQDVRLSASDGRLGNSPMNPRKEHMQAGGLTEEANSDESVMIQTRPTEFRTNNHDPERCSAGDGSGYWIGGNGWPGLSIFTPGSDFQ